MIEETLSHYRIIKKLGEGGMGEVYLAQDTKLDRKVALKILPADLAVNQDRMRRFVQEAKAASALNHPNIITIHEVDVTESGHFIATEFIDGETLRDHMQQQSMKTGVVLDVATQIASALSAAHAAGIVHRDIKPENIMLRRDGIVKVLDFGLAKLTERTAQAPIDAEATTRANIKTEPGAIMGTAVYMSPEQARGVAIDARTDIFSLGVVLYEIIAERLPFEGSKYEIIASILSDREVPPVTSARNVPAELERIVAKALRKDRDERYQNIKDLLLDLKSLKQRLEFEVELERSVPGTERPALAKSRIQPPGGTRSETRDLIPASSASSMLGRIRQRRRGAAVVIVVLILATLSAGYWFLIHRSARATAIDSIAVMPFENVAHDQKIEYLSDGVTESLINSLSQLPNVKVIGRNSVFSYKGQSPNLHQVAQTLDVRGVLTGRVSMQGDTLEVWVELTDMQNNAHLWGDHYVRKAADIFTVQDEIARQVTNALRVRLTNSQQNEVSKRYTENPEAYRLYLQGSYYENEDTDEGSQRATSLFSQAIALDPQYALAYAARGRTYFDMGDISLPMSEAMSKAKQDSLAALQIDDKVAEARMTLANIEFQGDWDFARAERDFKQVISLNANYAEVHHQYMYYLALMGKPMEALAEIKLAQQLDPVNPSIVADSALVFILARRYDESIAESRKALEMFPNFRLSHMALGLALAEKGEYDGGIQELEKAKLLDGSPFVIGQLGYAYAKGGRRDDARKVLSDLKELSKKSYVAPYFFAAIYAALNEKDEAFAWLEKAFQERSWWLCWIKMDPKMDSLRSESRFNALMSRVGFPQ